MTREEFLRSQDHWITKIQIDLYQQIETYMKANKLNRTQMAERLGVTKGYISQVLNGDFDHKISKLIELSLAVGLVPTISYKPIEEVIEEDKRNAVGRSESDLVHA